jgi:hypothetical protein
MAHVKSCAREVASMSLFLLIMTVLLLAVPALTSAEIWYVKPDGSGDAPTIQAAIDSASTGDTVMLANGVYTGVGNRGIDFRGKAITVRSELGVPELCVIDCELLPDEFRRGFRFRSGEGPESVLMGVTILRVGGMWVGLVGGGG